MAKIRSSHYVTLNGFRMWINPTKSGFTWADSGEQCDDCGHDEFSRVDCELVCDKCKNKFQIHNADGSICESISTQKESPVSKPATSAKPSGKATTKPASKTDKVAKAKSKELKVPRIGFGPYLREVLTASPKQTLQVEDIVKDMSKKFASLGRPEAQIRAWVFGIRRLLVKKGAAVSDLEGGKAEKAEKPAKAAKAEKPAAKPATKKVVKPAKATKPAKAEKAEIC